ncbi:MAG: alpha-L-fucosidase [Oscillospiraceae bacterium]|nr:alpha-L-fucosidase [Oscillospiraceae bacterium]
MSIPEAKQYIKDFEQLGFGVFVHFGLYSLLGEGEWTYELNKWDYDKYRKLMDKFNPRPMIELVREIKKSGAKYITFTTRHHDGFSLYDTCGLNDYDAPHSAAGRDIVREFVDACREEDIVPFLYHTTLDWWHKDFKNDFNSYLKYLRDSVEILCTRYGKIGGLWFDGNWSKTGEGDVWQEDELYALIRKYQPDAMIINNTGLTKLGELGHPEIDAVTCERGNASPIKRERMKKYITGEVCDSINNFWGVADDYDIKSPKVLIESLSNTRSAGLNYLINVGPCGDGSLDNMSKAILETMGKWMDKYGEAIYNGRPFWRSDVASNFVLKAEDAAYFFCFKLRFSANENAIIDGDKWAGEFEFKGFGLDVENIRWMDNGETLEFKKTDSGLKINFTPYRYGSDHVVRVAKGDLKNI